MKFTAPEIAEAGVNSDQLFGFPKSDLMQLMQTLIMGIVALLVMLLVVRPLLKKAFENSDAANLGQGQAAIAGGTLGGQAALAGPGGALAQGLANMEQPDAIDQLIDVSRVEGRVRASALKKVGEIIDKHPEESVSILRNWITQDGR